MAHVFQHPQTLVISRCCCAEDGYEMYTDCNVPVLSLFRSFNLLFGGVLVAVAVVVRLSSLIFFKHTVAISYL